MRRHVIIGRYGVNDRTRFQMGNGEVGTRLDLVSSERSLGWGIGSAIHALTHMKVHPSEIGVDALVLAAHVHAADTRISRDSESQDGWTREIHIIVPVSDPDLWNAASRTFERLLNFLTGDIWTLGFRARPRAFSSIAGRRRARATSLAFDDVMLFSGGLDSLIGAIDTLEVGGTPLFVSHAGEGATSSAQSMIFSALKGHYSGCTFDRLRVWMKFPNGLVSGSANEDTTRSRSFLFFALGVFAGSGIDRTIILKVPENGFIAVNVPLDPLRLGALSTRTTHPFYIARWNDALKMLGVNVRIENPYWSRTKGEMVRGCANGALLRTLTPSSLSCASPVKGRWQGLGSQHCGYCVPCLIRRAALLEGLRPDPDPTVYTVKNLRNGVLCTQKSEGIQVRSMQLAVDRLRAARARFLSDS